MRLAKLESGRYILHLGKEWGSPTIRLELSRKYDFGIGWNIKREEKELQFSIYIFRIVSLWLTIELKHFKYRSEPINTGIVWEPKDHSINIKLLSQMGMDSSMPAVIDKYFNYADFIFGERIYSESRHKEIKNVSMMMVERIYSMNLDMYTSYWHRPRSPFVLSKERVDITPDIPVPTPGKGENSWDLDEDATHSMTMLVNGRTAVELVDSFKESIIERRKRYGGNNWIPKKYVK